MQPDTDMCKIVIILLTQNINNMLLIVVPCALWDTYMVKLTMYLVSLAPRANNYLIQIIPENNFAQVEMLCVSKAGTHLPGDPRLLCSLT